MHVWKRGIKLVEKNKILKLIVGCMTDYSGLHNLTPSIKDRNFHQSEIGSSSAIKTTIFRPLLILIEFYISKLYWFIYQRKDEGCSMHARRVTNPWWPCSRPPSSIGMSEKCDSPLGVCNLDGQEKLPKTKFSRLMCVWHPPTPSSLPQNFHDTRRVWIRSFFNFFVETVANI